MPINIRKKRFSMMVNQLVREELQKGNLPTSAEFASKLNKLLREQESSHTKQERMHDQTKGNKREIEAIHHVDAIQDEADKKHDSLIAENASKNVEQDKQIAAGVKKDVEQDSEIQRQQNVDKQHDAELKKIKTLVWLGLGIAIAALIVAVIALIL